MTLIPFQRHICTEMNRNDHFQQKIISMVWNVVHHEILEMVSIVFILGILDLNNLFKIYDFGHPFKNSFGWIMLNQNVRGGDTNKDEN